MEITTQKTRNHRKKDDVSHDRNENYPQTAKGEGAKITLVSKMFFTNLKIETLKQSKRNFFLYPKSNIEHIFWC